MTLHLKNMVCDRCVMVVCSELERAGYTVCAVRLGEAEIAEELSPAQKSRLAERLEALGFELIEDRKSRIISEVKSSIVELVHGPGPLPAINLSAYLSDRLRLDYNYLSGLFSAAEGRTIEKFFIAQRIERVKELLICDQLTLGEIAFRLGYSSVAHLSAQFKRVTGLTPSSYKQSGDRKRRALDKV